MKKTVTLAFNPDEASVETVKQIFDDPIARTFWCLWRSSHIVSQYFNDTCLAFAREFHLLSPTTLDELFNCLPCNQDIGMDGHKWLRDNAGFFIGEDTLEIMTPNGPLT